MRALPGYTSTSLSSLTGEGRNIYAPILTELAAKLREVSRQVAANKDKLLREALTEGWPICRIYFDEGWHPETLPIAPPYKTEYRLTLRLASCCRRRWSNPEHP
jgi:hypothetical protein